MPESPGATPARKILQVCNTDFYLSRFLSPLVLALAGRGFEVHVAVEGEDVPERLRRGCAGIHQVSFPKRAAPGAFLDSIRQMRAIMRRHRFDCVDSHNRNSSIVARIAAWRERVPVNLYTAHGFYFHDDQGRAGWAATLALEAALARITDHTLSQSAEDTELMVRLGLIARDRIETIGNGIDHRKFTVTEPRQAVEARLGLPHGRFRIASIGRVVEGKGFADLVEAFARFRQADPAHSDSELVIVGGNIRADINPASERVRELINRHGLGDRVRMTGIIDNVQEWLHASDIFVSCSYREGMPRVVLEAMCAGLPVIVTRIRGSREVVADGVNGIVYEPRDVAGCADAVAELFRSPQRRREIGRVNRTLILERYTEDAYTDRQVAILERLVGPAVDAQR